MKIHLSVAFDEAKKLNDVNILLKIFGSSKTLEQDAEIEFRKFTKKSFKNFKIS